MATDRTKWPRDNGKGPSTSARTAKCDYDKRVQMQNDSYTSLEDKREKE